MLVHELGPDHVSLESKSSSQIPAIVNECWGSHLPGSRVSLSLVITPKGEFPSCPKPNAVQYTQTLEVVTVYELTGTWDRYREKHVVDIIVKRINTLQCVGGPCMHKCAQKMLLTAVISGKVFNEGDFHHTFQNFLSLYRSFIHL